MTFFLTYEHAETKLVVFQHFFGVSLEIENAASQIFDLNFSIDIEKAKRRFLSYLLTNRSSKRSNLKSMVAAR